MTGVGGVVLSGFVNAGTCHKGDVVHVGPLMNTKNCSSYMKASIRSIHVAQTNVDHVWAGHSACFTLSTTHLTKNEQRSIFQKGMVIVKEPTTAVPTTTFTAQMNFLKGINSTMTKGRYNATAHILHMKILVKIMNIEDHYDTFQNPHYNNKKKSSSSLVVRPGDQATITFQITGSSRPAVSVGDCHCIVFLGTEKNVSSLSETKASQFSFFS